MTVITIRKNRLLIGDLVIAFGSVWLSYLIRLESISLIQTISLIQRFTSHVWVMSVSALILKPVFFGMFGIYRIYWKYIGLRELTKLVASSTFGSIAVVLVSLILFKIGLSPTFPSSVVAWDWLISTSLFLLFRRVAY